MLSVYFIFVKAAIDFTYHHFDTEISQAAIGENFHSPNVNCTYSYVIMQTRQVISMIQLPYLVLESWRVVTRSTATILLFKADDVMYFRLLFDNGDYGRKTSDTPNLLLHSVM